MGHSMGHVIGHVIERITKKFLNHSKLLVLLMSSLLWLAPTANDLRERAEEDEQLDSLKEELRAAEQAERAAGSSQLSTRPPREKAAIKKEIRELNERRYSRNELEKAEKDQHAESISEQKSIKDSTAFRKSETNVTGVDALKAKAEDDDCPVSSSKIWSKSCPTTMIQMGKIFGAISGAAGSAIVQSQNSQGQMDAAQKGTQSAYYENAANTLSTTANLEKGAGAIQLFLGIANVAQARNRKRDADEIKNSTLGKLVLTADGGKEGKSVEIDKATEKTGETNTEHGHYSSPDAKTDLAITEMNLNEIGKIHEVSHSKQDISNAIEGAKQNLALRQAGLPPGAHTAELAAVKAKGIVDDGILRNESIETIEKNLLNNDPLTKQIASEPQMKKAIELNKKDTAKRKEGAEEKAGAFRKAYDSAKSEGAAEQLKIAKEAEGEAFKNIATGAGQLLKGYFDGLAADQMREAAAKLNQAENTTFGPNIAPQFGNQSADPVAPRSPITITGSGLPLDAAADDASNDKEAGGGGDLGPPIAEFKPPVDPSGPYGGFTGTPGTPGGGSGGGGTGGGIGGGTQPNEDKEQGVRTDKVTNPNTYVTGGVAGSTMNGGGSGGAKNEVGGGLDLSKVLDFLPKKGEENSNILQFGRNLAGDLPFSLLGRDVNIFQRVSKVYQEKNKLGRVGAL